MQLTRKLRTTVICLAALAVAASGLSTASEAQAAGPPGVPASSAKYTVPITKMQGGTTDGSSVYFAEVTKVSETVSTTYLYKCPKLASNPSCKRSATAIAGKVNGMTYDAGRKQLVLAIQGKPTARYYTTDLKPVLFTNATPAVAVFPVTLAAICVPPTLGIYAAGSGPNGYRAYTVMPSGAPRYDSNIVKPVSGYSGISSGALATIAGQYGTDWQSLGCTNSLIYTIRTNSSHSWVITFTWTGAVPDVYPLCATGKAQSDGCTTWIADEAENLFVLDGKVYVGFNAKSGNDYYMQFAGIPLA